MSIHLLAVNPSRSQHNVFAEIWDSQWFDVGKFALKEAISQHVLKDLLSAYDVSRTSVQTAHQSKLHWLRIIPKQGLILKDAVYLFPMTKIQSNIGT